MNTFYAGWVSLLSHRHQVRIPEHEREVGPPEHVASLYLGCRATDGSRPDWFPPTPAHGGIYLDNHPEQPGAYTVLYPRPSSILLPDLTRELS